MPAIIKPATATAQLTQAMVKAIIDSDLVPNGAISLICGGAGDLLDHLDSQDVVTFTGRHPPGSNCAYIRIWWRSLSPSPWKWTCWTAACWVTMSPQSSQNLRCLSVKCA
ncbi:hypothetical protein ACLK1Y_07730 [Escherichia coli]